MAVRYPSGKIISNRSYSIKEICRLYKRQRLHEQTVRLWIKKDGLKAFEFGRTLLIYGGVLKSFLQAKEQKRKKPINLNELKCWKCKYIGQPIDGSLKLLTYGRNKSIKLVGICPCGHEMEQLRSVKDLEEIRKIFTIEKDEVTGIYGSLGSTKSTHIERPLKKPLCEPVQNKPPPKIKSPNCTKKTHIENLQPDLFL